MSVTPLDKPFEEWTDADYNWAFALVAWHIAHCQNETIKLALIVLVLTLSFL